MVVVPPATQNTVLLKSWDLILQVFKYRQSCMSAFWSWVAGAIARGCCKVLLSECCLRFGAWLLQGAAARCCCQSAMCILELGCCRRCIMTAHAQCCVNFRRCFQRKKCMLTASPGEDMFLKAGHRTLEFSMELSQPSCL